MKRFKGKITVGRVILAGIILWIGIWYFTPTIVHFQDAIWAKTWKEGRFSYPTSVGVDDAGNIYMAGSCGDFMFSRDGGCTTWIPIPGNYSGFVMKMTPSGRIVWRHYWSRGQMNGIQSMMVDSAGNTYLAGSTGAEVDLDPGKGISKVGDFSKQEYFIFCLDPEGNFKWSGTLNSIFGQDLFGEISSIDLTKNNELVVFGNYSRSSGSGIFGSCIAQIDSNGAVDWSKLFPVDGNNTTYGACTDREGDFYLKEMVEHKSVDESGNTNSELTSRIVKLDDSFLSVWQIDLGYQCSGLAVDQSDNIYLAGQASIGTSYDPKVVQSDTGQANYREENFLVKFNPNGDFEWSRSWPAGRYDSRPALSMTPSGKILLAGSFTGAIDLDPGSGVSMTTPNILPEGYIGLTGSGNSLVCCYDASGNFLWARTGSNNGSATDAVEEKDGNIIVVGSLRGWSPNNGGAYIAKIRRPD